MTDDNKIISIFRGAARLQQQLGVLEAALGHNDELTVYEQLDLLVRKQRPTAPLCQALHSALLDIEEWHNPYITLNTAHCLIAVHPPGHAFTETGLPVYIRAAATLGADNPLLAFNALRFAQTRALPGSVPEQSLFGAMEQLCRTPNPIAALSIINHLVPLRRQLEPDDPLRPRLIGMISALAATISPHAPEEALDAYASLFRDVRNAGGEHLTAYIEAVAPLALRVGPHAPTEAAVCLSEVLDYLAPDHPLYKQARDYQARCEARLNPGDYHNQPPVAPADFLKKNPPQPT